MINLSVESDTTRIKVKLFELRQNVINKALPRALNKIAEQAKVAASKVIKSKLKKLKVSTIKKRITVIKATTNNQFSIVRGRGVRIPPGAFKVPGHPDDELWVRFGGGKHENVIAKTGKHAGQVIRSYTSIKRVPGLTTYEAYKTTAVQQAMINVIRDKFPAVFERELKFYGR
jgi:hypothetical protein